MVNVSRHGGTKNKYVREFNHLTLAQTCFRLPHVKLP